MPIFYGELPKEPAVWASAAFTRVTAMALPPNVWTPLTFDYTEWNDGGITLAADGGITLPAGAVNEYQITTNTHFPAVVTDSKLLKGVAPGTMRGVWLLVDGQRVGVHDEQVPRTNIEGTLLPDAIRLFSHRRITGGTRLTIIAYQDSSITMNLGTRTTSDTVFDPLYGPRISVTPVLRNA